MIDRSQEIFESLVNALKEGTYNEDSLALVQNPYWGIMTLKDEQIAEVIELLSNYPTVKYLKVSGLDFGPLSMKALARNRTLDRFSISGFHHSLMNLDPAFSLKNTVLREIKFGWILDSDKIEALLPYVLEAQWLDSFSIFIRLPGCKSECQ